MGAAWEGPGGGGEDYGKRMNPSIFYSTMSCPIFYSSCEHGDSCNKFHQMYQLFFSRIVEVGLHSILWELIHLKKDVSQLLNPNLFHINTPIECAVFFYLWQPWVRSMCTYYFFTDLFFNLMKFIHNKIFFLKACYALLATFCCELCMGHTHTHKITCIKGQIRNH